MGSNWLKIQRKEVGFGADGKPGGLFDDEAGPLGYNMNMYKEPPRETVAIEDFERYAIDRLRVLKAIEDAKSKASSQLELQELVKTLCAKHLKGSNRRETAQKDAVSHFVLRLAYCQTDDLRRWFLAQECELFKHRFKEELPDMQMAFIHANNLPFELISEEDFEMLKPGLVAVERSKGTPDAVLKEIQAGKRRHFFRVEFERVPDLVSSRRVYLRGGYAYVDKADVASLVMGYFRMDLSRALVLTSQKWQTQLAEQEADRLTPIVESLSTRYLGPDYGTARGPSETIMAQDIPALSQKHFPLCMQLMFEGLHRQNHLKHAGRLQFGLFLKGIGLPLEEALRFWRAEFGPKYPGEEFEKKGFAYGVRYNYAKEGRRTDYTPYSCIKIITTPVASGDVHGCPYKTYDADSLRAALTRLRVAPSAVDEAVSKARGGHFQLACSAAFEGCHGCECETGINHPNQYFDESRKLAKAALEGQTPLQLTGPSGGTGVQSAVKALTAGPAEVAARNAPPS